MTTRSLYIVGGPGSGKSTFLRSVLRFEEFGDVEEIAIAHNSRGSRIALRGQPISSGGVYLGILRDEYPGTDALDNVSHIPAVEWLSGPLPQRIVGEGLVLTTSKFLTALASSTALMLVHLTCSPEETARRFAARGSEQKDSWVQQATTRARNAAALVENLGGFVVHADTTGWPDHPEDRTTLRDMCRDWLGVADSPSL